MIRVLVFLALAALTGCQTSTALNEGRFPTFQEIVRDADGVCDIRDAMTPASLALPGVVEAVDAKCAELRALQATGIIPSAPSADHREQCRLTMDASETAGWKRLCGDPFVTLVRQSITVFADEAERAVAGYTRPALIVFDGQSTDAVLCGAGSITAISACGDEIFIRPSQLLTYSDPKAAAVYSAAHEVGHTIQSQGGYLADYETNGAFRELQSDCITGALVTNAGATDDELVRGVSLLASIGDLVTHGSAVERVAFARYGATNGVLACLSLTGSEMLT